MTLTNLILLITAGFSIYAWNKPDVLQKCLFEVYFIRQRKEYHRMLTSALIHSDVMHLAFNLFSLYSFGEVVEYLYGFPALLGIYLASILGGSALSLWIHQNSPQYAALGASGGVCGVIFASVFLIPGTSVQIMFIPIPIPGLLYAVLYIAYSIYGMKRQSDSIAHDAHFGGALVGMLSALVVDAQVVLYSLPLYVLSVALCAGGVFWVTRGQSTPWRR